MLKEAGDGLHSSEKDSGQASRLHKHKLPASCGSAVVVGGAVCAQSRMEVRPLEEGLAPCYIKVGWFVFSFADLK